MVLRPRIGGRNRGMTVNAPCPSGHGAFPLIRWKSDGQQWPVNAIGLIYHLTIGRGSNGAASPGSHTNRERTLEQPEATRTHRKGPPRVATGRNSRNTTAGRQHDTNTNRHLASTRRGSNKGWRSASMTRSANVLSSGGLSIPTIHRRVSQVDPRILRRPMMRVSCGPSICRTTNWRNWRSARRSM